MNEASTLIFTVLEGGLIQVTSELSLFFFVSFDELAAIARIDILQRKIGGTISPLVRCL
jgi:hypothetical protein